MFRACIVLAFALLSAGVASAGDPRIAFERFELPNGLKVYIVEDHKAPLVYEVLWVKAGSKDEVPNRTGFAHLFEHLMFKGSAHLPDGLMDRLLEAAGGWLNASTWPDRTVYENVGASNFLEQILWIESDRLAGLLDTFDQAKLDNQRDVVLNERRQSYENQPYGVADVLILDALWPKNHGYHWPTLGYTADLKAASLEDVSSFFRTYYVPNNATMVIAGDVKPAEVKRLVTKYFAWLPRAPMPKRPAYAPPPPITKEVVLDATDDVQVPRVYLSWRAPAMFTADEPAVAIAASILGGGKSSRLYKRLVYDEKIAQDVSVGIEDGELGGTFQVVATAKPGVDPKRLVDEISQEIAKLAAAQPSRVELDRALASFESDIYGELESTLDRAIQLAHYDVLAHDPSYLAKDIARHRAVTPAAVSAAATKFLAPTARVVLTIKPGKKLVIP